MSRSNLWGILLVCSIVSLISLLSVLEQDDNQGNFFKKIRDWEQHEKWIVSVASISIGMSGLGTVVTLVRPYSSMNLERPLVSPKPNCSEVWETAGESSDAHVASVPTP